MSVLIGFVCLLLAVFLFVAPSERKLPNRFLGLFLLLTAIDVSGWLFVGTDTSVLWLDAVRQSLGALQMPLFLWFVVSSCYADFKLKRWDILHGIPFVFALFVSLPGQQIPFGPDIAAGPTVFITAYEAQVRFITSQIQYYAYIFVCCQILLRFRSLFKEYHSGAPSAVFRWVSQLVIVSIFAHSLVVVRYVVSVSNYGTLFAILQIVGALTVLGVVTWITLKILLAPQLFRQVDRVLLRVSKFASADVQADTDSASDIQRVIGHMRDTKPYLDPALNLPRLADQLALVPRELSELINSAAGLHFFDFVNEFRISEAKEKLISDPKLSVLDIMLDVGFSSKSSFNTAFKKQTGLTPSAFRKTSSH
jgi:AraC-like DNA-binding protein